mgnify:FL=1
MKEYTDKQINSMIRHLKVKDIAKIQYVQNKIDVDISRDSEIRKNWVIQKNSNIKFVESYCDSGDLTYYDYKTNSHLTLSQLVASAIETGWEEKK